MEKNILIARRIKGQGDTWELDGAIDLTKIPKSLKSLIFNSLTEVLEAYVTINSYRGEFKLSPLKGELYILVEKETPPPETKKFNLYGDY